jgi:electron transfer flavoprotein beta subunit
MLAELLEWPHASFASKVEIDAAGKSARVTCEVDGGLEVVDVELPAVITTDLRLNEPRYASLPGILKAKKKPSAVIPLAEVQGLPSSQVRVATYRALPARQKGEMVESAEVLAERLLAKRHQPRMTRIARIGNPHSQFTAALKLSEGAHDHPHPCHS